MAEAEPFRVLSFDAGITHVGMVAAEVSRDWTRIHITHAACVDLTRVEHRRVPKKKCNIPHTNSLAHRYAHFVQEMGPAFNEANYYFVEQQPPQSAGMVFEQLLHLDCQGQTTSVPPSKIHARFGLPRGDYERRKEASEQCAVKLFPELKQYMTEASRGHDIADAACILKYECECRHVLWRRREMSREMNLMQFAYKPEFCRACQVEGDTGQSAYTQEDCPRCRVKLQLTR